MEKKESDVRECLKYSGRWQQWLHWFERQSGFERLIVLSRAASPLFSQLAITKGGRMAQLCHVDVNTPRVVSSQERVQKASFWLKMGGKGTERKPRAAHFRSLARLFARQKRRDPCSVWYWSKFGCG